MHYRLLQILMVFYLLNFLDAYMSLSKSDQATTANYLSVCIKNSGDFMLKVLPSFSGNLNNLRTSLYNSANYNFTQMT